MKVIPKEVSMLSILESTIGDASTIRYDEPWMKKEAGQKQGEEARELFRKAKRFVLNVEAAQNAYALHYRDIFNSRVTHFTKYTNFELPFPETLICFEQPIEIRWALHSRATGEDAAKTYSLAGMLIKEMPLTTWIGAEDIQKRKNLGEKGYRLFLLLLEDYFADGKAVPEDMVSIGYQYIDFVVTKPAFDREKIKQIPSEIQARFPFLKDDFDAVYHLMHLCRDKEHCVCDAGGNFRSGGKPCQEYLNRVSLLEMLFYVVEALNKKTVIEKPKAVPRPPKDMPTGSVVSPLSDYYTSTLRDSRYVYDAINEGTGTKHRFRYDVRRHPRIVKDRIIWVSPHVRGVGEYIPKVYTHHSVISVPYFWEKVEQATRVRWIERLAIFVIRLYRRFV